MEVGSSTDRRKSNLKTVVSILIATATVAAALVGWRASIAGGAAGAADSRGLEAALHAANTGTSISTYLSGNLSFFAEYQEHLARAMGLGAACAAEADLARRGALAAEALRERTLAAASLAYVNADYIALDPSTGEEYFDGDRFWDAQWAEAAAAKPIDSAPAFAEADLARQKARGLTGATVGFAVGLFALAAATAASRRLMWILLGLAVPTLLAASALAAWFECFV